MQFPEVEGENLAGQQLAFPSDFGKKTIAIVAFDLKQREDIESWVPFVDRYARDGTINGRVFPVISRSMRMMKGMILTTMRKVAPSTEALEATVPLFVDINEFCATLDIVDRSAIHIYVVDAAGTILDRQCGPYSEGSAAAIEALVGVSA